MRVVICGAGVIGACAAYFLARRGVRPIIVERAGVACAASGKSGGFLALDWCDRTPLEGVARRSFALHARLADELDDDWGYRRLTTYAGVGIHGGRARANRHRLPWCRTAFRSAAAWARRRRPPKSIRAGSPRRCCTPRRRMERSCEADP